MNGMKLYYRQQKIKAQIKQERVRHIQVAAVKRKGIAPVAEQIQEALVEKQEQKGKGQLLIMHKTLQIYI